LLYVILLIMAFNGIRMWHKSIQNNSAALPQNAA
jgi:hypothetical protein